MSVRWHAALQLFEPVLDDHNCAASCEARVSGVKQAGAHQDRFPSAVTAYWPAVTHRRRSDPQEVQPRNSSLGVRL